VNDRIRRYIDHAPEAISGQGGHSTTLKVARCLFNGFGLDECQVFTWLQTYNARLADKWTDRELLHKAKSAAEATYDKPRGWMLATVATVSGYTQPSSVAVWGAKKTPLGTKKGKKYVLATVATELCYIPSAASRARTRTRGHPRSWKHRWQAWRNR
jgi:hypothetical protein